MVDDAARGAGLKDEELAAVQRVVRALVERDVEYLQQISAYSQGDPYVSTHHWRLWDHVDLTMPPGHPRTWITGAYREENGLWVSVDVQMWTEQEGRSDLTLELDLGHESAEAIEVRFRGLHVM